MKICVSCKRKQKTGEFYRRGDGLQSYCKKCCAEKAGPRQNLVRARNQQYVFDYLATRKCMDCPESDPLVLQFDHREDEVKETEVSDAVHRKWSIERLSKEMSKCDIRCANCHIRKTAKQFGWHQYGGIGIKTR